MTNKKKHIQSFIQLGLFLGVIILVNILANIRIGTTPLYTYFDLTEDKRYSLTDPTRTLLRNLDDVVYVQVLLDGEFPAGFKRLQRATREMLDDFRGESGYIEYAFEDPSQGTIEEINQGRETLAKEGIIPTNLRVKENNETSVKLIYPYAIFYYKGRSMPVQLLENQVPGMPQEIVLNNSVGLLEYKFANAIQKLQRAVKPPIAFTTGHGELGPGQTADLERSLRQSYETGRLHLDSTTSISTDLAALIVAKPTQSFSEKDKFKIDQYIMKGGKVLWLIDKVAVSLDSLRSGLFLPREYDLNLDDLLFRYGIRIQPNLVLDMQATVIPLAVGNIGNAPQFDNFVYPYHPIVVPASDHPIVKSVDGVNLKYASSIDTTVRTKTEVKKTVLLSTSPRTRMQFLPVRMDFEFLKYELDANLFNKGRQPVAMALEGVFPSMYENRVTQTMRQTLEELGQELLTESLPNRMVVVADGDIVKNKIDPRNNQVSPLGLNEYDRQIYANKDFLLNSIEYLVDDIGLIEARGKEVKLRLLDMTKVEQERTQWQLLNLLVPLVFLLIFGVLFNWIRKRRFAR
jgi:ABC-2 type transport system permease protein